MNLFADAIAWMLSPEQWTGNYALPKLLAEHLTLTAISVLIAAAIALPLGWLIGHTGRGREIAVAISGAARAIPAFGLMVLLVLVLGVLRVPEAAITTFVLLAIPSLLAGAYTGLEAIDRRVIDAARAMGMTEWQLFWKVEVRLGLPLLVGGIRSALLQVIATVTIAAYVNLGGLGWPIIQGIPLRRFDQVLGGALIVAVLALLVDLLLAAAQHAAVPRGLRTGRPARRRTRPLTPAPAPAAATA
ncbi:Carnitine transport permease protein OpuCB [Microbacterium oxydans]|uniref:Carnitine transport permease protein OpuCB n=1 Tax=Microbacterium oxydans TaxID=82380 RepID=A0A0F0LKF8_9MICO|nr:ABC transporter permease [Microbacterium oxydans]KJL32026.1 Carnitine transport permease protein OpuCB [Microbacterium oxydans]CAH0256607.1 Carnitine transport permease protein OpuCB [Microbacterium oxydans]